jgi:hypothetical protein
MDVASQIAVMNHAQIEQVGTPTELYDRPATEFVMRFVGEASRLGAGWVRPHQLDVAHHPAPDSVEALIERITTYGFDARIELVTADGENVTVQMTREHLERSSSSAARSCGFAPTASACSSRPSACPAIGRRRPPAWSLEHAAHRRAQVDPDRRQRLRGPVVADAVRAHAAHGRDRPSTARMCCGVDLVGRPGQRVPALDSAPAVTVLAWRRSSRMLSRNLVDPLGGRKLLALDELAGGGELEHRARVVGLGGDAHAATVRNRRGREVSIAAWRLEGRRCPERTRIRSISMPTRLPQPFHRRGRP